MATPVAKSVRWTSLIAAESLYSEFEMGRVTSSNSAITAAALWYSPVKLLPAAHVPCLFACVSASLDCSPDVSPYTRYKHQANGRIFSYHSSLFSWLCELHDVLRDRDWKYRHRLRRRCIEADGAAWRTSPANHTDQVRYTQSERTLQLTDLAKIDVCLALALE